MEAEILTTGEAARVCAVTPDTVLKWIRSGRLKAQRTVGGHHRIRRQDLDRAIGTEAQFESRAEEAGATVAPLRYCWEYNGGGRLLEACRECAVYRMRAHRCYEVVQHARAVGHKKAFCRKTCADCEYYRLVHLQAANVLTITDNERLVRHLQETATRARFNVEFANCEYTCSAAVDRFRPDFVVIDCSLGRDVVRDMIEHLQVDPRIPGVRVILAVEPGEVVSGCDKGVFARIEKPFSGDDLATCVSAVGGPGV
ncbi:MAG: excisionase family DNA-binding protein [Deltaproteobacteria bacterium]|nr:excisionase family DNA-binding protein [Deltaproteobacteria bacterium]